MISNSNFPIGKETRPNLHALVKHQQDLYFRCL